MFFARSQVRVGGERLRNHADGVADAVRIRYHVVPADHGHARGGRRQRRHHADQRRFPRAVGSQQAEDFARMDREAHFVYSHKIAKLFFQFDDFDRIGFNCIHRRLCRTTFNCFVEHGILFGARLYRLRINSKSRDSERSEESLFELALRKETRRESSLRSEWQIETFFLQPV